MVGTAPTGGREPGANLPVLVISWTFTTVALASTGVRLYLRRKVSRRLLSDDWFMLFAGICQIVFQACLTTAVVFRLRGGKAWDPEQMIDVIKWAWIGAIPGGMTALLARISITISLIRIFGSKIWLKWYLIVWTSLLALFAVVTVASFGIQGRPIERLWDPQVPASEFMISIVLAFGTQVGFTISDLTYVLFPSIVVWNLNMTRSKKMGIYVMLGLSLITMAVSIVKIVEYINNHAVIWASVEQSLVILMSNVPALRPLTKSAFPQAQQWLADRFDTSRWTINSARGDGESMKKEYAGS